MFVWLMIYCKGVPCGDRVYSAGRRQASQKCKQMQPWLGQGRLIGKVSRTLAGYVSRCSAQIANTLTVVWHAFGMPV